VPNAPVVGFPAPSKFHPTDPVVADEDPSTSRRQTELEARTHGLLVEARDADPARRQELLEEVVTLHLWLAESLSRRFLHRGEEADDLLQVARTGLVEAAQRFDPDRGPFLAFAVPTITGVLKRHFRDHGWIVRPPRRTQELASGVWQQWPALVQAMGAIPSATELAAELGESLEAVQQARCASQCYRATSLDLAMTWGGSFGGASNSEQLDQSEARMIIAQAWSRLDESERELLRLRFFEERSQSEIAAAIGTSQMQVSRLLARVLRKLRGIIGTLEPVPLAS
jgi:RNA polymerase sigma-B factor